MIRIVAGELRKVWQGKVFWMIIAIAIAINLGYIQFSEQIFMSSEREQEISEEPSSLAYKKFDEKLAKVKDRQQFIEEYYKQIKGLLLVEQVQTYQASNSELSVKMAEGMVKEREEEYNRYFSQWKEKDYRIYTDNLETEGVFAEEIYKKYAEEKDYNAYLNQIFQQEEEKLGISIFAHSAIDSFSEDVIRKTSKKYQGMKGTKTNFYSFKWLEKSRKNEITDILIVLVVFMVAMYLIFEDKKKNLFSIIKATPCGRSRCISAKLFTLALSTVFITFILYLSMLIYIGWNFGLAGINESIQSANIFIACPYHFKVWQFLLISIFMKSAACSIFAFFMLFISMLSNNYIVPFGSGMMLVLGNMLLYGSFASVGKYNIFHYLNIWSFIKFENLIGNYSLINIAGVPISATDMAVFLIIVFVTVLIFINVFVFVKVRGMCGYSKKIKFNVSINKICKEKRVAKKLISYEAYKIYRISGCALIIALFIIGMIISGAKSNSYLSPNQESYRIQMKTLEGKMTDQKERIVLEKKQYYEDILAQLKHLEEKYEAGKIVQEVYEDRKLSLESKLALYPSFLRVYDRYEYVKSHKGARFVYEDGYSKMIGKMDYWYLDIVFIIAMLLVIIQSTVFTLDKERSMESLIRATPRGRRISGFYKAGIGVLNATILYLCFMTRNIYIANRFYGLNLWSVSICNLKGFERAPEFIPIALGVFLFGMVQLVILIAFSILVMFLSKKIGSAIRAIIIQLVVLTAIYVLCFSKYLT